MNRAFVSLAVLGLLAFAGSHAHATSTPESLNAVSPASGSGVPQGASGANVPFTNDGANRPVLETLTPDGQSIPIDPAAADSVKSPELPLDPLMNPEEQLGEHAGLEDGAHEKQGLPQFDVSTFAKQIFWLTIVFVALYLVNSKKILPTISSVIENRRERIASDLRAAEDLKNQVAKVRGEYEAAVAAAQSQAQQVIVDLQVEMKKQTEYQDGEFKERAERAVDDLEARLDVARTRITAELGTIAADITRDITKAISGVAIDEKTAQRTIDTIQGKQEAA